MFALLPNQAYSISDLAASLTDPALEALAGTGTRGDSVEMELELWRTLTDELKHELHLRRFARFDDEAPVNETLQRVVHRATWRVAEQSASSEQPAWRAERADGPRHHFQQETSATSPLRRLRQLSAVARSYAC